MSAWNVGSPSARVPGTLPTHLGDEPLPRTAQTPPNRVPGPDDAFRNSVSEIHRSMTGIVLIQLFPRPAPTVRLCGLYSVASNQRARAVTFDAA